MKQILAFTIALLALAACKPTRMNVPNPATVYCQQNGYNHEKTTAEDGDQGGMCMFPDGSVCDEWAYYRGECGPAEPPTTTPAMTAEATTEASGGSPGGGSNSGGDASGGYIPPGTTDEIADWRGVIKSTEPAAQFDDYFELWTNGQMIYFGIDSVDPAVQAQIEAVRDSGKTVHLYGTLFSNVPDYNGSQVLVDRIVVEE